VICDNINFFNVNVSEIITLIDFIGFENNDLICHINLWSKDWCGAFWHCAQPKFYEWLSKGFCLDFRTADINSTLVQVNILCVHLKSSISQFINSVNSTSKDVVNYSHRI